MPSSSSRRWLDEHFSDEYVKRTQAEGRRSRAFFKLLEIDRKDRLFKPNAVVVDLGAAPGGWTEYAVERLGVEQADKHKLVFALDVLPMQPLAGAQIITGDFTEQSVLEGLQKHLQTHGRTDVDLVISDMAPNFSGVVTVDQPRSMLLAELALEFAELHLVKGGCLVCKVFHGQGFDDYLLQCRQQFTNVVIRKPDASRSRSKEVYLVAKGYKGRKQ